MLSIPLNDINGEVVEQIIKQAQNPELPEIQQKAERLLTYVTGYKHDYLIRCLFEHEKNISGGKILDYRVANTPAKVKTYISEANAIINNIVNNIKPTNNEVENNILKEISNSFYGGKTILQYSTDLVNNQASPFDWLFLDVFESDERSVPVIKPIIIPIQSIHYIEFDCGKPISIQWRVNGSHMNYLDKNYLIIIKRSNEVTEPIEADNYRKFNYEHYIVEVFYRGLPELPAMPLGYVEDELHSKFKGNDFSNLTSLLEELTKVESRRSCFAAKHLNFERIRLKIGKKESLVNLSESERQEQDETEKYGHSEIANTTEYNNVDIQEVLTLGTAVNYTIHDQEPPLNTFNEIKNESEHLQGLIQTAVLGHDLFNKERATFTATEIKQQENAKKDTAKRRLNKITELYYFTLKTIKDYLVVQQVQGVKQDEVITFNYPSDISIQSEADILEEYKSAKDAGTSNEILNNIMSKYFMAVYGGDTVQRDKDMAWYYVNPLKHCAKLELMNIVASNQYSVIYGDWRIDLTINEDYYRDIIERKYEGFYSLPIQSQIKLIKDEIDANQITDSQAFRESLTAGN